MTPPLVHTIRRYKMAEDHRSTKAGIEYIVLKGEIVLALREVIDYERGTHKVLIKTTRKTDTTAEAEPRACQIKVWVHHRELRVLR